MNADSVFGNDIILMCFFRDRPLQLGSFPIGEVQFELFDGQELWDDLLEPERLESLFIGKNVLGLIHTPEKHAETRNQILFYYLESSDDAPMVYVSTNVEPYDPSSHKKVMGAMVPYFSTYIAPH